MVNHSFVLGRRRPAPHVPLDRTLIYEVHVKGFTQLHPDVPEELRGTYAGIGSAPALDYLTKLGITAVELLPVHQHVTDRHLVERGLVNYWGYNTIGFFAPRHPLLQPPASRSASSRRWCKRLHDAGIEVILDVVYNHTGEGNHLGPTLSFRGIDNAAYYRLDPDDPAHYIDYTGTGNTLDATSPRVLQLIMDSLRYWITEMHVDGFRFDLASALARELHDVDKLGSFFDIIHQDPIISQVKLIAEPWDVGPGGYQVGNFPVGWAEWNGKYRDTVRRFWKGVGGQAAELAYRLSGSSDLYASSRPPAPRQHQLRHRPRWLHARTTSSATSRSTTRPTARTTDDGDDNNESMNFGVEGETDEEAIIETRERQKRNLLATLLLSQGVPMLLGGDEIGRTQAGNNNGYAQDNEISWFDWELQRRDRQLLAFTRSLIRLFKAHPVLRRRHFFQGRPDPRLAGQGPDLVPPRRHRDDRRGVAGARRQDAGACSSPVTRSTIAGRAASGSSTTRCSSSSTPTTGRLRSRCPTTRPPGAGRPCSTPCTAPSPRRTGTTMAAPRTGRRALRGLPAAPAARAARQRRLNARPAWP